MRDARIADRHDGYPRPPGVRGIVSSAALQPASLTAVGDLTPAPGRTARDGTISARRGHKSEIGRSRQSPARGVSLLGGRCASETPGLGKSAPGTGPTAHTQAGGHHPGPRPSARSGTERFSDTPSSIPNVDGDPESQCGFSLEVRARGRRVPRRDWSGELGGWGCLGAASGHFRARRIP
jgi:hypothetical protein